MRFWTSRPAAFLRKAWGALSDWNELATDVIGAALHRFVRRCGLLAATATLIALGVGAAGGRGILIQAIFHNTATGGADRTAYSKLADFVSVKDFGALCDGSTDDSAAFTAALTASKLVMVPSGTCSLGTTGLSLPGNTALVGAGQAATVLSYSGTGCAITVDSVSDWSIAELEIFATGASATKRGLCLSNTTAANLRGKTSNVKVWGDQNPPVAGTYGVYIHSTTAFSLYYMEFEHLDLNLWDKGVYALGDIGFGGANANKFLAPQVNACITGLDFQGVAGANFVYALHCNASGTAFAQTCLNIGDGVNNSSGNHVDLYSDQGASGKPYAIATASSKNWVWSVNSSSVAGTQPVLTGDKNFVTEMSSTSSRVAVNVGNVQMLADSALGGIYISPTSGNPGVFQCNATNVANNIACLMKSNTQLASAGDLMWSWRNNSGFTNSTDLRTGGAGTDAAAIDLNGALRQAGLTNANLGQPAQPPNGTFIYCSDCTIANPCAGGGTGALAKRLNGVWVCN